MLQHHPITPADESTQDKLSSNDTVNEGCQRSLIMISPEISIRVMRFVVLVKASPKKAGDDGREEDYCNLDPAVLPTRSKRPPLFRTLRVWKQAAGWRWVRASINTVIHIAPCPGLSTVP